MAKTQWHPLFAELLKLVLQDYYDVQPEFPLSELPRCADVLVVRRTAEEPPFEALWSWLREWNVIEFKGMSDRAEVADLELLLHVGTGVMVRLNEQRRSRGETPLRNHQVAFFYVAPALPDDGVFLKEAQNLHWVKYESEGVWRSEVWSHPIYFVSARDLPRKVDSLPLLLLDESAPSPAALFASDVALVKRLGSWLARFRPKLLQEIIMAEGLQSDWNVIASIPGIENAVRAMGAKRVVEALGVGEVVKSLDVGEVVKAAGAGNVIKSMGAEKAVDEILALLTPEQLQELIARKTQKQPPQPDAGGPQKES